MKCKRKTNKEKRKKTNVKDNKENLKSLQYIWKTLILWAKKCRNPKKMYWEQCNKMDAHQNK